MIKFLIGIILSLAFTSGLFSQEVFQLAPPLLQYNSIFFSDEANFKLAFAQQDTHIHYTTNGKIPTENDPVYSGPVSVKKNLTTVIARVFGNGWRPSETVQVTFVKDGLTIKKVSHPAADQKYEGEGLNTLLDNKGGLPAFTSNTWLGFRQDTVVISIKPDQKRKIHAVLFDLLQDQGHWIFFPETVKAFRTNKQNGQMTELGELKLIPEKGKDIIVSRPFLIRFKKKVKTDTVILHLYILKNIPAWHPGKGERSWIFIDEVKLY